MKLISEISIDHFRSIKSDRIQKMGEFTALAGLNNSGKSNVLRALNAFFTGTTDPGVSIRHANDYYRHDLRSKKRLKNISIQVSFELPTSFKFRKRLEPVAAKLGRSFSIRKAWSRASTLPEYFLNTESKPLSSDDRDIVDQFLSLINFRYIPNRVLPLEIVQAEHRALRDLLIRRLSTKAKGQADMFKSIQDTSASLMRSLQQSMTRACPGIGDICLKTPTSWQDLIFAFGYRLSASGVEIEDHAQGSGIQSLLMLETLSLIDRDYFQKFGWRQAAVWAIEEPESSLHASLEAKVSNYLSDLATTPANRLQIIATTHSDLILQNADQTIFIKSESGVTQFASYDKRTILEKAALFGISRYSHPILAEPLRPLILVEGKYDHAFISKAIRLLAPTANIRVAYLKMLEENGSTGGNSALLKYLQANRGAIRFRASEAPLTILLDWDAKKSMDQYQKICDGQSIYSVKVWPDTSFNPNLGKEFRGIERHMSDRIIEEANNKVNVLGKTNDGKWTVNTERYNQSFKPAVYEVVCDGIKEEDLSHARSFIQQLIQEMQHIVQNETRTKIDPPGVS